MVAKAIVVRKSLGPKRPYGFESHPRHTKKHRSGDAFLVPSTVISVPGQIFGRFPARTAAFPSAAGIFAAWAAEDSKYFTFVHRSGIDSNRSQPKSGNDNKLEL